MSLAKSGSLGGSKITYFPKKVYFDQLLDLPILLLLFLHTLLLWHISVFSALWMQDFSIPSGCQTVWIQIRPDILLGLIWVQTVCKGYISSQQKSSLVGKELNTKHFFLYYFLA